MDAPKQNIPVAIFSKLGAVFFFMAMATLVKIASARVPPGETVFFRSFFGLPIILGWIAMRGELRTGLKTDNPQGHFWRGLVGVTAMSMGFAALGLLPLSEVKAIQYAQPVLVVIFAAMFLGERVRAFRLTAVALGMTGVLIIMSPRLTAFSDSGTDPYLAIGAMLAFGSAVMAGLAHVFVRKLTMSEPTSAIVFWFAVTASTLSLMTLPFGWVWPTGPEAAALVGAGICGGIGQIFLTSSYRYADASVVAPFEYFSILLALAIGYFVFEEVPTAVMLIGIALIVCAGILIIWREGKLGHERKQARKAMTPQG
ncbi:drug/metabolite transporter (DMT)-like permease [Litoreibacter halocynthiae]|uniref:Drug/metabolite transporter (DMT)-like permease n=1 Tax=Litoreibacter halocynthiae TaxID=1242689 RepID=A0A4R7LDP0_9RHOB|nr:DMT family transporter [Litoreibacter halocynthiae]TDT73697.1 drug/metabolite transporter (DMT)-like permease [Litoreibacter halocynthiae]